MNTYPILIVDDDQVDRYILKRLLKQTDIACKVFEAENGAVGLEFLDDYHSNKNLYNDDFPPIVIFLDVNMPLVNGFEFLEGFEKISQKYDLNSSVILMFSSSQREGDKERAFSFDFVKSYIVKMPTDASELKNIILESIAKQQ